MFTLRLFGAPLVAGPEGPLAGPVAQRHRLALLALLASAPSGAVSREKLLGLLWPDHDTESARGLLNVAVHTVRKALGEAAIHTVGSTLQLDPGVLRSDVGAFTEALCRGEPERAVEEYAGPFLDGFFLDAEEFDRWAEAERARLAGMFDEALERLAEAARQSGDPARAASWWKRRAAESPTDSRVALRLMEALAAAGDRAGALQHARVHEALLRAELDASPDPAITAFAERVRADPGVVAPPSSRTSGDGPAGSDSPEPETGAGTGGAEEARPLAPRETEAEPAPTEPAPSAPPAAGVVPPSPTRRRRVPSRPLLALAAVVLLLAVAAVYLTVLRGSQGESLRGSDALAERYSIAVLPFADRSPRRDHEWLGDGMSEEIITALARLPGLQVAARTSAFSFKGKDEDVRVIGERLGVRYVLEGSVGTLDDRLRVTARLVSAHDGHPVWSRTFDRDTADIFAVQDEIARAVVRTLRPPVAGLTDSTLVQSSTADLEAYRLFQRARHSWHSRTLDGLTNGVELLRQAVARDSSFAEAYAGLAECHALLVTFGALSPHEGYPRALAAAERALALDSTLAPAHASLALVKLYYQRDWPGAGRELAQALRHNPGYATARHWHATYLSFQGRFDEALAELERAQRLDPFSAPLLTSGATILYYARRYDEAADRIHDALVVDPDYWVAYVQLAAVHAQEGRYEEALATVGHARRLAPGNPLPEAVRGYVLATSGRHGEARAAIRALDHQRSRQYVSAAYAAAIYTGLGERDAAMERLERAFEERDDWVVYLGVEPAFDPLRSDPRFVELIARINRRR